MRCQKEKETKSDKLAVFQDGELSGFGKREVA
jgi:hypothetical protein